MQYLLPQSCVKGVNEKVRAFKTDEQFSLPPGYCQKIEAEAIMHKTDELIKILESRFFYLNDKGEFYELTDDELHESELLMQTIERLAGTWWPCVATKTEEKTKESLPRWNKQLTDLGFTPLSEKTIALNHYG